MIVKPEWLIYDRWTRTETKVHAFHEGDSLKKISFCGRTYMSTMLTAPSETEMQNKCRRCEAALEKLEKT